MFIRDPGTKEGSISAPLAIDPLHFPLVLRSEPFDEPPADFCNGMEAFPFGQGGPSIRRLDTLPVPADSSLPNGTGAPTLNGTDNICCTV